MALARRSPALQRGFPGIPAVKSPRSHQSSRQPLGVPAVPLPHRAGSIITKVRVPGGRGQCPQRGSRQGLVGTERAALVAVLWGRPGMSMLQPELGQIPVLQSYLENPFFSWSFLFLTRQDGVQEAFMDLQPTTQDLATPGRHGRAASSPWLLGGVV